MHTAIKNKASFPPHHLTLVYSDRSSESNSAIIWASFLVIHFQPDSSQLFKNCRPWVHHFSERSHDIPRTLVFCRGRDLYRSLGDWPGLSYRSFCSNNPLYIRCTPFRCDDFGFFAGLDCVTLFWKMRKKFVNQGTPNWAPSDVSSFLVQVTKLVETTC